MDITQLNEIKRKIDPERHRNVNPINKQFKNLDHSLKDIYNKIEFEKFSTSDSKPQQNRYIIDMIDNII